MYKNILQGISLKDVIYLKYVTMKDCHFYMYIVLNIYAYFLRYVCFIHYFINMLIFSLQKLFNQ